jgi:hypothetical protein
MSDASGGGYSDDLDTQSYEFKAELKIRKLLERNTDWQFEATKNDQYSYDLKITQWSDSPRKPADNNVVGYVELERARRDRPESWVTGSIPDSWVFYSFLKRKVYEYDHNSGVWQDLKSDHDRTVYLKFNHALDNCFAAPVSVIYHDGTETKHSDGSYNDTYLALDLNHETVRVGIDECVSFIQSYLNDRKTGQQSLLSFGGQE